MQLILHHVMHACRAYRRVQLEMHHAVRVIDHKYGEMGEHRLNGADPLILACILLFVIARNSERHHYYASYAGISRAVRHSC